eukprot:SAG11_NODE_10228_length_845_cov_4.107239_1_plen_73_part_01
MRFFFVCVFFQIEFSQFLLRFSLGRQGKTVNVQKSEELYGLLIKALYGHQSAGRKWAAHRDSWAMMKFSSNGW